jgi:hypothetical protein
MAAATDPERQARVTLSFLTEPREPFGGRPWRDQQALRALRS